MLSLLGLVAGLVRPSWVIRWGNKGTRRQVLLTYGLSSIVFLTLIGTTSNNPAIKPVAQETEPTPSTVIEQKQAEKPSDFEITPTATATPEPTPTPLPILIPMPMVCSSPTPVPTLTPTPVPVITTTPTATPTFAPTPTPILLLVEEARELENSISELVNEKRGELGLSSLTRSPHLDELARGYSASKHLDDFRKTSELRYLLHNSWSQKFPSGSPWFNADDDEEMINFCLEHPDFKDAMLHPDGRAMGMGIAVIDDTIYYTQVFDVLRVIGGDGKRIRLYENPRAVDVDWNTLKSFLMKDATDRQIYIDRSHGESSFVCADYAEMLHNNAEQAGIRTAYVSIKFPNSDSGHALNAFSVDGETVFIDCTGSTTPDPEISHDNVAYIEMGKSYGTIDLTIAEGFTYDYLEQYIVSVNKYKKEREACDESMNNYNNNVQQYNENVHDYNAHPTEEEYESLIAERVRLNEWDWQLGDWDKQLRQEAKSLGMGSGYYDPVHSLEDVADSTVIRIYIHW
ncbi:MAG: hypothetical protein J7L90_03760 [Dehalococcoidia bacterium]|nr:hypothetical protein [Dehalococcoidia bacterium]